jgi:hypothetical protein
MKLIGLGLLSLLLVTSCGKNNESGKSNSQWSYSNPYVSGYAPLNNINSPYSYSGMSVNQVMAQNPCRSGWGGMTGYNTNYSGQRIPIVVPLANFPSVIAPGDVYVGVTSYGDVAVLAGTAPNQPPVFEAYLCPRSFSPSGQGQLAGIKIGAYSNCLFKPITAATVILPGGATAEFRWLDGGSSMGTKFTFCR